MSIVSSTFILDAHTQADGRKYVQEVHTDSTGAVHTFNYLAAVGENYTAIMTARAAQLEIDLAEREAQEVLNG